ncbi:alpha/beta-hydrolase [Cadophora sp. DSE1049]|nr:alpha/beta-hydrolase [Cadophora sp. DSE1049]
MAAVLLQIEHLVRYASLANDSGTAFRARAPELQGKPYGARILQIGTPTWIGANTRVHLGIRNGNILVLAFSGIDMPFTLDTYIDLQRWQRFVSSIVMLFTYNLTEILWLHPDHKGLLIHEGFLKSFNNLLVNDRLLTKITTLMPNPSNIEICGHGLGGVLATICALWCRMTWPGAQITCVTLGSPRVGNDIFATEFSNRNITCYRLVNGSDPIPTIPDRYSQAVPWNLRMTHNLYRHVGIPLWLGHDKLPTLGLERPDIQHEEAAGNLTAEGWWLYLVFFVIYWTVRAGQMLFKNQRHSPVEYSTVVQRILETRRDCW